MKALFTVTFDHALPRYPDAHGNDLLLSVSRVGKVPIGGVSTNVVQLETDDATMAALKADPDYLWIEDVEEAPDA